MDPSLSAPKPTFTPSTSVRKNGAEKLKAEQMIINAENSFSRILGQLFESRDNASPTSSDLSSEIPDLTSSFMLNSLNQLQTPINQSSTYSNYPSLPSTTVPDNLSQVAGNLNQELGGRLKGMGQAFANAGKIYGVNPILLASISTHETGNGSSKAAYERNNISGTMTSNGLKTYASIEDSIMDMARNIKVNYLDQGLHSIQEIGKKYAPIGADNDPTNLNQYWVSQVTKNFNKLSV